MVDKRRFYEPKIQEPHYKYMTDFKIQKRTTKPRIMRNQNYRMKVSYLLNPTSA